MDIIKVGILGAPGAGKSRLANKLAKALTHDENALGPRKYPWKVIDGYVEKLSKRTGLTFGPIYNRHAYRCNLQVVAERWTLEDQALSRGCNTITCGTIYDTVVYASAQSMEIPYLGNEQLILEEALIARSMMEMYSVVSDITFDYDCLLYLPAPDVKRDSWDAVVDAKVLDVLEGQNRTAIELRDTPKKNFGTALYAITQIASTIASYEQQAARQRAGASEGFEYEFEPLSDLSSEEDRGSSGNMDVA